MRYALMVIGGILALSGIVWMSIIGYYPNDIPVILGMLAVGAVMLTIGSKMNERKDDSDAQRALANLNASNYRVQGTPAAAPFPAPTPGATAPAPVPAPVPEPAPAPKPAPAIPAAQPNPVTVDPALGDPVKVGDYWVGEIVNEHRFTGTSWEPYGGYRLGDIVGNHRFDGTGWQPFNNA
mgnify:CR=1 FL=1